MWSKNKIQWLYHLMNNLLTKNLRRNFQLMHYFKAFAFFFSILFYLSSPVWENLTYAESEWIQLAGQSECFENEAPVPMRQRLVFQKTIPQQKMEKGIVRGINPLWISFQLLPLSPLRPVRLYLYNAALII